MTRLKDTRCPWCFKVHELVSGIAEKGTKEEPIPEDGDVTFCIACGKPSMFDHTHKFGLRFPTKQEWATIQEHVIAMGVMHAFSTIPDRPQRTIRRRPDWDQR